LSDSLFITFGAHGACKVSLLDVLTDWNFTMTTVSCLSCLVYFFFLLNQYYMQMQTLVKQYFMIAGPNRAFGDLIASSGITEGMIDSLILLKDVRDVPGLPPLTEIEDEAIERMNATSSRAEVERQKQEEIAKARVRQVDEKGRAYGTGKRKCSIARVWIEPGDGKFIVNEKEFDAYFPILDHRADLLRPFTVTKTLGLWDVTCTVKGGGVSG
jgi:small subunit ribosomal protein S9